LITAELTCLDKPATMVVGSSAETGLWLHCICLLDLSLYIERFLEDRFDVNDRRAVHLISDVTLPLMQAVPVFLLKL